MKKIIRILSIILIVFAVGNEHATAQTSTTVTHTVNRGETLASIAQKYHTSEAKIIELNPEAAQFVYVGMELTLPAGASATVNNVDNVSDQSAGTSNTSNSSYSSYPQQYHSSSNFEPVISQLGVDYVAAFKNDGKGYYGFFFETLANQGYGVFFSAGASYGIVKKGQLHFRLGPDYGRRLNENITFSSPLCLTVTTYNNLKEQTYKNEKTTLKKEDLGAMWGVSLTPKIAISIEKVNINVGLDMNYNFKTKFTTKYKNFPIVGNYETTTNLGGKLLWGFFVAIGFNY